VLANVAHCGQHQGRIEVGELLDELTDGPGSAGGAVVAPAMAHDASTGGSAPAWLAGLSAR
jgi:hypothetical protein